MRRIRFSWCPSSCSTREFQLYTNNRSNSYVENGVLYLQPTLTSDTIGTQNVSIASTISIDEVVGGWMDGWMDKWIESNFHLLDDDRIDLHSFMSYQVEGTVPFRHDMWGKGVGLHSSHLITRISNNPLLVVLIRPMA